MDQAIARMHSGSKERGLRRAPCCANDGHGGIVNKCALRAARGSAGTKKDVITLGEAKGKNNRFFGSLDTAKGSV